MKEVIVGITGASGIIYGIKILEELKKKKIKTHLILTKTSESILKEETRYTIDYLKSISSYLYDNTNLRSNIASGSFILNHNVNMIIAPCSMNTIGKIASGISDNLIIRSADVCLKENKKLVLMIRETPLNEIHIKNMLIVKKAGGIIFPTSPYFYNDPKTIDELIDPLIGRALNLIEIKSNLLKDWNPSKKDIYN